MTPQSSLTVIRSTTCYGALRSIIEMAAILLIGVQLVFIAGAIAAPLTGKAKESGIEPQHLIWVCVGMCVVLSFGIFVVVAIRQAGLLLIDIADTLVAGHARPRP